MLFKIPKTKDMPGKFEDQWSDGVYVGFDMRTLESLIATVAGVFKVTDVRRRPLDERWSADKVLGMQGSPKQPVPGQVSRRTQAYARKFEDPSRRPENFADQRPTEQDPVNIRNWKIVRSDIVEFGETEGCVGC